jgi:hypothetical protein
MTAFRSLFALVAGALLVSCAASPDAPPYPAFVIADELPDLFLANLPGVRAKEFAGDMRSRTVSNRIDLPEAWSGTTGGSPGKALEIYILSGELSLADVDLVAGGYVYVPPGSLGFNLVSDGGARVLWFLSDVDDDASIRSPLIIDSRLIDWQPTDQIGVFIKDLRNDPGSGEHTWLMRYEPGVVIPWQARSAALEGYLVSGQFQQSECVNGLAYTDVYLPGGYFNRPADAVHGGPQAAVLSEATWFLREKKQPSIDYDVDCLIE